MRRAPCRPLRRRPYAPGPAGPGGGGSWARIGCPNSGQASLRQCQPSSARVPGWVQVGHMGGASVTRPSLRGSSPPGRTAAPPELSAGRQRHWVEERIHRPRLVKPTITANIQYCERVAWRARV